MLRISKETKLNPGDVVQSASRFFGEGGEGLNVTERGPCCISFEGAGGYLTVAVVEGEKSRTVEIETREFEYPAKQFLRNIR